MDLLWPGFLLLLGIIPLLIALYIWNLRRRRRYAVHFSSLSLLREVLPKQSRLRRHLPFALFLLALTSLVIALGRPVDFVAVPADQATIILTIDVSRSMRQTDIAPSRLAAAKDAAISFIQRQHPNTQIGIVAFSGFAELIHPPTTDQEELETAVRSLTTGRRTAIGDGILRSLEVITELDQNIAPVTGDAGMPASPAPGPRGVYAPSIIVLLTDGVSTTGPMPLDAAQQAVDRGIRVYTIGFGTEQGQPGFGMGGQPQGDIYGNTDPQAGGDQFGGWFRRGIDEATLKEIAGMTGGTYYEANSAGELQAVFENLPTTLITKTETMEISVIFAAIGALSAAIAIILGLLWHPHP